MKIVFGVNVLDSVSSQVYLSHLAFMGAFKQKHPDSKVLIYTPERTGIDRMRNEAARIALQEECDYLMFVDDDVFIEPNTFDSLASIDADVAMAETYVRGYPFNAMWFVEKEGRFQHDNDCAPKESGFSFCDAVGFSCVLIKCSLLKKLTTPYFVTGPNFTEDVYFCVKAQRELGKENVKIAVDHRVPTGHTIAGQYVTKENVKLLRAFHKAQYGELLNPPKDRGEEYLKEVENLFKSTQGELFK